MIMRDAKVVGYRDEALVHCQLASLILYLRRGKCSAQLSKDHQLAPTKEGRPQGIRRIAL